MLCLMTRPRLRVTAETNPADTGRVHVEAPLINISAQYRENEVLFFHVLALGKIIFGAGSQSHSWVSFIPPQIKRFHHGGEGTELGKR